MARNKEFEVALTALRDGKSTFREFVEATRPHFRALAGTVLKQWDVPVWMGREDIEQEMYIAGWIFVNRFDPTRGVGIEGFMVYNMFDKAKKRVHKARGANLHRKADSNPSTYERPFSTLVREGEEDSAVERRLVNEVPALQAAHVERVEGLTKAKKVCGSIRELLAIQAMYHAVDDSIESAAALLYRDSEARRLCRLGSEEHAQKVLRKAVRSVAERLQYL